MKEDIMDKVLLYGTMALTALAGLTGCGASGHTGEGTGYAAVTVYTTVRNIGQYPERLVLTFANTIEDTDLDPSQFALSGKAGYWGSSDTRDFECSFESVEVSGNTITLVPHDFPEKYFYVKEFAVTCDGHPEYGFTSSEITKVVTPVADDFATIRNDAGIIFDYHLYTPDEQKNMPVVIVFHGYGDINNLLTYKTAVEWAQPDNQAKRPCYVIAPVIDNDTYTDPEGRDKVYTALKDILDSMISDGRVDRDRVYVMGNSFGGVATIEFSEKYPETVAAAMALCPALNYALDATARLDRIRDIPIWFAHAAGDGTIPVSVSRDAVLTLEEMGAANVRFTEYTDEQMNAAGADGSPDSTYSYHHVELAVMEDDAYQEWMFEHKAGGIQASQIGVSDKRIRDDL